MHTSTHEPARTGLVSRLSRGGLDFEDRFDNLNLDGAGYPQSVVGGSRGGGEVGGNKLCRRLQLVE